jgi:hypothetical protein
MADNINDLKQQLQNLNDKLKEAGGLGINLSDAFSRAEFNTLNINSVTNCNLAHIATGNYVKSIPEDIRLIIESHHNDVNGHHGIQRTFEVIKQRFKTITQKGNQPPVDIQHLPQYCRQFVNECVKCQLFKQLKPIIMDLKFTIEDIS